MACPKDGIANSIYEYGTDVSVESSTGDSSGAYKLTASLFSAVVANVVFFV